MISQIDNIMFYYFTIIIYKYDVQQLYYEYTISILTLKNYSSDDSHEKKQLYLGSILYNM